LVAPLPVPRWVLLYPVTMTVQKALFSVVWPVLLQAHILVAARMASVSIRTRLVSVTPLLAHKKYSAPESRQNQVLAIAGAFFCALRCAGT